MKNRIEELGQEIEKDPNNTTKLLERAKLYYKLGDKAAAYNDLVLILKIEPTNNEAAVYEQLLRDIFNFGNREQINV